MIDRYIIEQDGKKEVLYILYREHCTVPYRGSTGAAETVTLLLQILCLLPGQNVFRDIFQG